MNRRSFLSALAGVPIVRKYIGRLAPLPPDETGISLRMVRSFNIREGWIINRFDVRYGHDMYYDDDTKVLVHGATDSDT